MIGYVTLGSNDLGRAVPFYDALLKELGASQIMNDGRMIIWGTDRSSPMLAVCTPHDEKPASVGNGVMVALSAGSPDMVNQLHARALELGGADEGAPGPRSGAFFGGYFRDLDGNKLNAFFIG